MNIKRAKQEIIDSIQSYLLKDENGEAVIPVILQRPILLIGAPGIGKTQIMEQIAEQCGISLVSYTITHHTRQSAIGLPFITKKQYDGLEYSVTNYTMSEIVGSVYDKIEESGVREGILFIDEINCVSETLAPAMLQFLQCKTFGNHEIPKGWIVVAAGNPPEYNKSVREFDMVTMDRVKKIEVEPDFSVWKEYAYKAEMHPAILSYLNSRTVNFYRMETTVEGRSFATPRGWEDLSRLILAYERLHKNVDKEVIVQYLQFPEVARDFANYLELFYKYQEDYQAEEILGGTIREALLMKVAHAPFDERLSLIGILLSRLNGQFKKVWQLEQRLVRTQDAFARGEISEGLTDREKAAFEEDAEKYQKWSDEGAAMLEHAFDFMESAFLESQEMVIFVTELNTSFYSVFFLGENACERYLNYNKRLLLNDVNQELLQRIERL